jgi:hypothetical protein
MLDILDKDKPFAKYLIDKDKTDEKPQMNNTEILPNVSRLSSAQRPLTTGHFNKTSSSNAFSMRGMSKDGSSIYIITIANKFKTEYERNFILSQLSAGRSKNHVPNSRRQKKLHEIMSNTHGFSQTGFSGHFSAKTEMLSTAATFKSYKSPKKKLAEEAPKMSQFLFVQNNYWEPVVIKDQKVQTLYQEVKSGPFNTCCKKCNNRNLEFYDKLDQETALNVLNYIRLSRMKNSHLKILSKN